MPAREQKSVSRTNEPPSHPLAKTLGPAAKARTGRFYPAGNSTRINAFVSAQGRRNQAKRDGK